MSNITAKEAKKIMSKRRAKMNKLCSSTNTLMDDIILCAENGRDLMYRYLNKKEIILLKKLGYKLMSWEEPFYQISWD